MLLKGLGEMNSKIKNKFDYDNIARSWMELKTYVMQKKMNKLLVIGKKNILGLESFYYHMPYITNARVISPKAKLIKIDKEHLDQILIKSSECIHELEAKVDDTLKIITKRLFGLNNINLKIIENKINLREELKLEKLENQNQTEIRIMQDNNPFIKRIMKIIQPSNQNLINASEEIKNISLFENEQNKNKKFKKYDYSLFLSEDSNINKNQRISSGLPKNRINDYYNKGKISSSAYEKRLLKKIKKEMISLRKEKNLFFSLIKSSKRNKNTEEKNNKEEKSVQINSNDKIYSNFNDELIKLNSFFKKEEGGFPTSNDDIINKNSNDNSFEFVTKVNNIQPYDTFDKNIKKSRNQNLPKIKMNRLIGKNSFLSIKSKNDISSQNKNKSTKDLNVNFSYNNRIIKNYSFINKYIYKDNTIIKDFDPKEKYRIFDYYNKGISQTKKENKINLSEIKKYIPKKTIRSKDLINKIKRYQEYRKKIQRKIEEMTS